jgi:hypothetical protein
MIVLNNLSECTNICPKTIVSFIKESPPYQNLSLDLYFVGILYLLLILSINFGLIIKCCNIKNCNHDNCIAHQFIDNLIPKFLHATDDYKVLFLSTSDNNKIFQK